ncbi:GcrA family cell cycle regulator [Enterovirga aerilata]|uniref:GcrA cell cycle regulator n=1 Tax=Enterovirga aerilata TaxID=2730920 RepID=A0A849IM60_9HYPH|nr:GcrA family cell cycle regulator [Enterovirga sp. DB1703]NNM75033.1 hypothetical protein [Enterovirga sp. DB1703]
MIGWTDTAADSAAAMWREGKSASEIAAALNRAFSDRDYTRGSVLGKLDRLGLVGGGRPTRHARKLPVKAGPVAASVGLLGPVAARLAAVPAVPSAPVISAEQRKTAFVDRPGSISWDDLRSGDKRCRWPLTADDGSTRYCGNDVAGLTYSFCCYHRALAFGRGAPSERFAHQVSGAAA